MSLAAHNILCRLLLGLICLTAAGCATTPASKTGDSCPVNFTPLRAAIDQEFHEQLRAIHAKITALAGVRAEFQISRGGAPNAYAFQKGQQNFIVINLPMLDLLGENFAEYAFVIGHEAAHLKGKHGKKESAYQKNVQLASSALGLALEAVGIGLGIPFSGLISNATVDSGAHLIKLGYSRDQEREADELGLELMVAAGYDPAGALSFQKKLAGLPNKKIAILSTHPASAERLRNLEELVNKYRALPPPPGFKKEALKE